jgi:hypothetical protein
MTGTRPSKRRPQPSVRRLLQTADPSIGRVGSGGELERIGDRLDGRLLDGVGELGIEAAYAADQVGEIGPRGPASLRNPTRPSNEAWSQPGLASRTTRCDSASTLTYLVSWDQLAVAAAAGLSGTAT